MTEDSDSTFEFVTHPNLYTVIPEPEPAQHEIPYWFQKLPMEKSGGSERKALRNSTAKACMPLMEAMKAGWIFKTPADIHLKVQDGKAAWNTRFDYQVISPFNDGEVGDKFPEDGPILNFRGRWRINAPDGWSMLFTPPMNRPGESRFRAFSGVISIDKYDGEINHPALWTAGNWEGVIPQGTPIAQGIPFRRDWFEADATARAATEEEELDLSRFTKSIQANQRHYRENLYEPMESARTTKAEPPEDADTESIDTGVNTSELETEWEKND